MEYLEKFRDFPVGTFFSGKVTPAGKVRYGVILGATFNSGNDLVFTVKWADTNEASFLHPVYVQVIDYDWDIDNG